MNSDEFTAGATSVYKLGSTVHQFCKPLHFTCSEDTVKLRLSFSRNLRHLHVCIGDTRRPLRKNVSVVLYKQTSRIPKEYFSIFLILTSKKTNLGPTGKK